MNKWSILLLATIFSSAGLSAEAPLQNYGRSGSFELSSGLSVAYTRNERNLQQYNVGLLPYANHFIFNHWFLRYDLGLGYNYTDAYAIGYTLALSPGLAMGYNFSLADRWKLNFSAGYGLNYAWFYNDYFGSSSSASHSINFYPELKYILTENWILSILMKTTTNLPNMIFSNEKSFAITTNTYIVASYVF
jgi:hypothetical protein